MTYYLLASNCAGADLQSVPSLYREARIANPRQQGQQGGFFGEKNAFLTF